MYEPWCIGLATVHTRIIPQEQRTILITPKYIHWLILTQNLLHANPKPSLHHPLRLPYTRPHWEPQQYGLLGPMASLCWAAYQEETHPRKPRLNLTPVRKAGPNPRAPSIIMARQGAQRRDLATPLRPIPKRSKDPTMEAVGPKYYTYNGCCHHIWVLGPAGIPILQ